MNTVIDRPEGIDSYIQQHQTLLYDRLILLWGEMGLTSTNFQMYGRAYRNYKDGGYVPEVFIGSKDYQEVLLNDRLAALMWYGLNDPEKVNSTQHTYNVSLYGFVNLNALKPGVTAQRMDNAVVNDVCKLADLKYGFSVKEVHRDVDKVLERFSGTQKKQALNQDMQPYFCFRIDMTNTIWLNNCNATAFNYPRYQNAMTISYTAVFKDSPNTALKQRLSNGVMAQLEFPTGSSVTIPYLAGKYILKGQLLNTSPAVLDYSDTTGTLAAPDGGFRNDDILIIDVNVP